jgi:hypothetical protein
MPLKSDRLCCCRGLWFDSPSLAIHETSGVQTASRADKGKEYLNKPFQDLMRREGIEHRTCRNPDVKCAVVERVHRTIRENLYKYFTHKKIFRYIDVLQKFVSAYNDTVHSKTGVVPAKVNDSNILDIWKLHGDNIKRVRVVKPKYKLDQHVRKKRKKWYLPKLLNRITARRFSELQK